MTLPMLVPLTVEQLRREGVPEPFGFGRADRVRFGELDVLDHVNNARYLGWFETFRIAYLAAYGISRPGGPRPVLVLRSVAIEFRAPLHLDEAYIVAGRTRAYRTTSWSMEFGVWSAGRLRTTSEAVVVLMEGDATTRRPLPAHYIDAFTERDGAIHEG